jgi:hypothetical protein
VAIVGYRIIIRKDGNIVHTVEDAWAEDDNPNAHLNDAMEAWEAEQGGPALGAYVISYERLD